MSSKLIAGKIEVKGSIEVISGLHIGSLAEFSPIGPVDHVVVRDALTRLPIIPGSSLKGKLRSLLSKIRALGNNDSINQDLYSQDLDRLFGSVASYPSENAREHYESRLQFYDLLLTNADMLTGKTDLLYTEIKFENTINRKTAEAYPRQIERVPSGARFCLKMMYTVNYYEDSHEMERQALEDFRLITSALKLLQVDYLGGHGSRGYGKVKLEDLSCQFKLAVNDKLDEGKINYLTHEFNTLLLSVTSDALLCI